MKEHLALLGFEVRDVVTGFTGVVTSVNFALFGCIQAVVTPLANTEKKAESLWFDTNRLKIISEKPVMAQPNFQSVTGGEELPLFHERSLPGQP